MPIHQENLYLVRFKIELVSLNGVLYESSDKQATILILDCDHLFKKLKYS